ncbi:MAG: hypothetical protein EAX90_01955 [Candidatus Heimdallarchaeota archaeon]|nr:hypothetical protein [Candidatus Heimdallarchaeota archaeon]
MTNEIIQTSFKNIEGYITKLEEKLTKKEQQIQEMENKANMIAEEKDSAAEKLRQMEEEMQQLSSVYEELKSSKDVEINLQEVMKLYVILTEQVLDGNAHIRILTLLHGKKEKMSKEELSKASGIQPAATLRAIFELRNNGLVTYEEDTEKVKLVRRLFT